jgi:hypothetical protein
MSDNAICVGCETSLLPEARFCSTCGRPRTSPMASASPPPPPPPGASGGSQTTAVLSSTVPLTGAADNGSADPYPQTNVMLAAILTLFAPFISLVAALLLAQEQRNPVRRQQLKKWAIASGAWLVVGGLVLFAGLSSLTVGASDSACEGGIDHLTPPTYIGSPGNWKAQYTCNNGGTFTRPAHAKWLNN